MKLRCLAPILLASLTLFIPPQTTWAQNKPSPSLSNVPQQIEVVLRPAADTNAVLHRVAGSVGRVFVRDPQSHTYRLLLGPGVSRETAVRKLRTDKAVVAARVWDDRSTPAVSKLGSVRNIGRAMTALEALDFRQEKAEKIREAQGPTIAALEKMKNASPREGRESAKDALGAYKYWYEQRAFPFDKIPANAYKKAVAQRARLKRAPLGKKPHGGVGIESIGGAWEFLGPKDFGNQGASGPARNPRSGRANAVAYDPQNPGTYYLGAAGGGLWVTYDSGANWTPLGDFWTFMQVSSIAVDPNDSQTIYAGTGDYDGFGFYGFGLQKSTDGGVTWDTLGANEFGQTNVSAIVVDPTNSQSVTVATGQSSFVASYVWHSEDGGLTWAKAIPVASDWKGLGMSVVGLKGRFWMFAAGANSDFWRSTDHGKTWTQLVSPAKLGNVNISMSAIDFATIYLTSFSDRKVFKSIDSGNSWNDISGMLNLAANAPAWNQGWYDLVIRATPSIDIFGLPEDNIYLGLIEPWQEFNELVDWRNINGNTHADNHAWEFNPGVAGESLVGNDGGAYLLNYDRKKDTNVFTPLNKTLGITQFYKGAWHPTDGSIMVGGTQDNGTAIAVGNLDQWDEVIGADGGGVAINPDKPGIQYGTIYGAAVFRTGDMWQTVADISPDTTKPTADNLPFVTVIKLDPNDSNILYMGTNYLWQWNDKTSTWNPRIGGKNLSPFGVITAIELFYGHNDRVYVGTSDGLIWLTTEFRTFTQLNGPTSGFPLRSITGINCNPNDRDDILASCSGFGTGHLWRCADTRAITPTFVNVSGSGSDALPDVPVNAITRDPWNPDSTWFVATDVGVFMTTDAGNTWTNATAPLGLPNVQVNDIQANLGTAYLNVATFGRGMWRIGILPDEAVIDTLTLNPNTACDGSSVTATVRLRYPAPTGGAIINISTTDAVNTTVPASITIPEGVQTGTFPITTLPVLAQKIVTITVASPTNGSTANANLTIFPLVPKSLTVSPNPAVAGFSATGTVTLNYPAVSGHTVTLSSSDTTVATVPATVNVAAGGSTATFSITLPDSAAGKSVTLSAKLNGVTVTTNLDVIGILDSLGFSPALVLGGQPITGTVNLKLPAPAGGVVVNLSSASPAIASVPASVTVAAGSTQKTFTVTTTKPANDTSVTITATSHGGSKSADVYIVSVLKTTLAFNPNPVKGGSNSTGTITLNAPAPAGGITISLASADSTLVAVPASVFIGAGSTQKSFQANTVAVSTSTDVNVTALYGGSATTTKLTLLPTNFPSNLTFKPNPACANSFSIGTLTLGNPAPAGGASVTMSSSNPSVAVPPATVTVPAGALTTTYSVITKDVPVDTTVTITAVYNGVSKSGNLTVRASVLTSATITPANIKGGGNITLTINLSCPAGANGAAVSLTSTNPGLINVPPTVTVPAGKSAFNFVIPTNTTGGTMTVTIGASYNGISRSATVTVVP